MTTGYLPIKMTATSPRPMASRPLSYHASRVVGSLSRMDAVALWGRGSTVGFSARGGGWRASLASCYNRVSRKFRNKASLRQGG